MTTRYTKRPPVFRHIFLFVHLSFLLKPNTVSCNSLAVSGKTGTICFATTELQCFIHPTGGLGRAFLLQAASLIRAGFPVKIIGLSYERKAPTKFPNLCPDDDAAKTVENYVQVLERNLDYFRGMPNSIPSAHLLQWLENNPGTCRVLHVADYQGHGVYATLAKRAGLTFMKDTYVNVQVHGTHSFISPEITLSASLGSVFADAQERIQFENADSVVFLNGESADQFTKRWRTAAPISIIPNIVKRIDTSCPVNEAKWITSVSKIFFYGKMDERKGSSLFLSAVSKLDRSLLRGKTVYLVGPKVPYISRNYSKELSEVVPEDTRVESLHSLTTQQVIELFSCHKKDGLVVIPSYIDFQSFALFDVMQSGIPFIASDIFAHRAQIPVGHHRNLLFKLSPRSLAVALTKKLSRQVTWSQQSTTWVPYHAESLWRKWHNSILKRATKLSLKKIIPVDVSTVVVCCDDHRFLGDALRSVVMQADYPHHRIKIVLVAACPADSTCKSLLTQANEALQKLNVSTPSIVCAEDDATVFSGANNTVEAEARRHKRRQAYRRTNTDAANELKHPLSLGRARNIGVDHSDSDIVLFLDEDDELDAYAVVKYVRAFQLNDADVLTSFADIFYHDDTMDLKVQQTDARYHQLGGAPELGFIVNGLGGSNMAINKSSLLWRATRGFTDDTSIGCEDWEFLLKAAVAGRLRHISTRGLWYRKLVTPSGMLSELATSDLLFARCRTRVIKGALDFLTVNPSVRGNFMSLLPTFQYLANLYQNGEGQKW